ncbi:hypothetical protein VNI00_015742 [Paramarasmius palmivorus]|uniref:F-box domain-containing protein n=1 Tax=Paramarasmius palmivorus TaxID=297713 RepID=A0AAW0BJF4_9AGAR
MTGATTLVNLPADVLIHLLSFLSVPEILIFRQTSKAMHDISRQSIVWINACKRDIISRSWPWTSNEHDRTQNFEKATRNAWRLGCRWTNHLVTAMIPQKQRRFATNTSTAISDVRFFDVIFGPTQTLQKMVLTVSKGIWSVLTLWSIGERESGEEANKLAEWSPKGALFTGLAINDDTKALERLAVSVAKDSGHETLLLSVTFAQGKWSLLPTHRIPTPHGASPLRPLNFFGCILALSDDISQTVILDWKTREMALLVEDADGEADATAAGNWKHNIPIQVLFTYRSITVVRARSVSLFPEPILSRPESRSSEVSATTVQNDPDVGEENSEERSDTPRLSPNAPSYIPLATHSFGWVDAVAVVPIVPTQTIRPVSGADEHLKVDPRHARDLRILVRAESDNPWRSDEGTLDMYLLEVNTEFVEAEETPLRDSVTSSGGARGRSPLALSAPSPRSHSHHDPFSIPESTSTSASPPRAPASAPYTFPPTHIGSLSSPRGSLRCTSVRLGPCGTAVWVSPPLLPHHEAAFGLGNAGLVVDEGAVHGASILHDEP